MNEDWLNKIHDRMGDYEIDEPDKLWEAIESRLSAESITSRTSKRHVILKWIERSIEAAAILAIVVSLCLRLLNDSASTSPTLLVSETPHPNHDIEKISSKNTGLQRAIITTPLQNITSHRPVTRNLNLQKYIHPGIVEDMPSKEETSTSSPKSESETSDSVTTRAMRPIKNTYNNDRYVASNISRSIGNNKKVIFSVFTSGGTGSMLNRHSSGGIMAGTIGTDNTDWKDSPMLGVLTFNKGKEIKTDIKHRLPIRAGFSFTYNITDRIGIESGISYTHLTSAIREGSDSHYYSTEQKLHYIGIPVNLKYRIISWKNFDLYASAGMLAEKCISAKLDKEFIIDNKNKGSETEDIKEKPMQWSVNTSAGLQYNLLNSVGVYVEPGVSYYFKDNTSIQTIYKDKPLNFNLNLGVRFSFGK